MFSTPAYHLICEIVPGHWSQSLINLPSVGAAVGRSTYPTPAHALAQALGRNAQAAFEIHLRADDEQAPVDVRSGLLKLRDAGVAQARAPYELTARQIAETGLTVEELDALRADTLYLGAPAVVLEQLDAETFALELAVVVQGD
ncbi:hypothetical protein ABZO35_31185 [Burkholderia pseudomallei]|uniref:hypothetical protein n=1 Tax=Burkholderia pseudomallei TaxID=28450 RepID=UPI000A1A0F9A|nr:hypothetical protein [Burkholderia pseudomallei]ARK82151.1 hypothetical protein BOC40_18615 [Burkholderia pseudomallei]ARL10551.1 hypothetical protein BOC45_18645 [Burkholderia pseudomallei]ARL47884.1 hypothetical protein BOC50_34535 [Burkholderia pseudomallei]